MKLILQATGVIVGVVTFSLLIHNDNNKNTYNLIDSKPKVIEIADLNDPEPKVIEVADLNDPEPKIIQKT
jgi:hypothetical protein